MKKYIILSAISIVMLIASCHKDIDIYNADDFNAQIVVNSITGVDSTIKVFVTKSVIPGQLSDSTIKINNAIVKLYEDGIFKENLTYVNLPFNLGYENPSKPYFKSNYIASQNHTYTIEVEAIEQKATAEFSFPTRVSTVELLPKECTSFDTSEYMNSYCDYYLNFPLDITINDPEDEKNYYMINVFVKRYDFAYDTIQEILYDTIYSDINVNGWLGFDNTITDVQYVNAPIPSSDKPWDRSYIFNDEVFNGQEFSTTLNANISGEKLKDVNEITLYYQVFTISTELFNYYVSINKYNQTSGNPFVEPVNIFSNVEGGIGIVAGYNMHYDSLQITLPDNEIGNGK